MFLTMMTIAVYNLTCPAPIFPPLPYLQANVVQANLLSSQTKPAMLSLEVDVADDDDHSITAITAHVWRAEMLTGVLEVDKDQIITKAGCCPLHQPGG